MAKVTPKKVGRLLYDVFIPVAPVKPQGKSQIQYVQSHSTSDNQEKKSGVKVAIQDETTSVAEEVNQEYEEMAKGHVHRNLTSRHLQLIAIGGTIGVALFVNVSSTLAKCGPLSLLLACIFWCTPIFAVTVSCAEMVCHLPIPSPFVRLAERCVDDAFSFMTGWNFWVLEGSLIPWELTLFNTLVHYWTEDYSPAIIFACMMVGYFIINVATVKYYGEVEFYLGMGKVLLAIGLMVFVFITMVGGNPEHDVYGFRNWKTPMAEYLHKGDLGRFQGWLAGCIAYSFLIAGPEYISMAAGEVKNPRKALPSAYKAVFYRLTIFFIGGAFAMGTCCSYKDPLLAKALSSGAPGAGSSAYTIAMNNMNIKVLPHIVNVVLLTSAFSAGNSYTYCASRSLYGMSIEGKAPRFFQYCNKDGVPIYAVLLSLCWGFLAFLNLGKNSNVVLTWIVNLVTASQMINFCSILITFLHFRGAVIAQGVDRDAFTFKGWFQPYLAYYGLFIIICMIGVQGFEKNKVLETNGP
ncbi:unnamed protein product [Ambrosiozyma monospora]|uniref:Unnamed protein product n=1 Tax=Ambrosiozyma monospora TaxID=43982 RepID=A0ACB5TIZ6_AMBMO|nr:unnamed protein product [Ambrosiozyma monospora]